MDSVQEVPDQVTVPEQEAVPDQETAMKTPFDGTMMCARLPRETRDEIYERAWVAPDDREWGSGRDTYLMLMNHPFGPHDDEFPSYLHHGIPEVLHAPVREENIQIATELVQWLYEHVDLGYTMFSTYGVFFEKAELPSTPCERAEEGFPELEIEDVKRMLSMDVFGVGVTPADCKLRSLSFRAEYSSENARYCTLLDPPEIFAELEALPKMMADMNKTENFQLRIMLVAWRSDKIPDARLVIQLQNLFCRVCKELEQVGVTVLPTYLEYDLHEDFWYEAGGRLRSDCDYNMTEAIGAENLPESDQFDNGIPVPRFLRWEEAFCSITNTRIDDPLFV